MSADAANSTPSDGLAAEPALIYDAGKRRTHDEHAAEARNFAQRAESFARFAESVSEEGWKLSPSEEDACRHRAQWHATMAVYHAIVDQGWR
jgi:hypothetical protein